MKILLLVSLTMLPESIFVDKEYYRLRKHFTWLNYSVYETIVKESKRNNINPILMMSLIQYESGDYCNNNFSYMEKVVSHSGAIGVMQVMPFHLKKPLNLFYYKHNIKIGVKYFKLCKKKAKKTCGKSIPWVHTALRFYNQGMNGSAVKYKNWSYVERIIKKFKKASK